jgi:hypothetical protein
MVLVLGAGVLVAMTTDARMLIATLKHTLALA